MSESNPSDSRKDDIHSKISKFHRLYKEADNFAREISEFRDEISIPAHNELRYAGYHIIKALNDNGTISDEEQLRRAISHCERAEYEAAEAGIIFVIESISRFREDFKNIVIGDIIPSYSDIIIKVRKAQDLLALGRSDEITSSERASRYMETFRELRQADETLEANRDDLNARLSEQVRGKRRFIIRSLLIILSGVIATILASVLSDFKEAHDLIPK